MTVFTFVEMEMPVANLLILRHVQSLALLDCVSYKYLEIKTAILQYRYRLCNIEVHWIPSVFFPSEYIIHVASFAKSCAGGLRLLQIFENIWIAPA